MFPSYFMSPYGERSVTIRRATPADRYAIRRIAERDSRRTPDGDLLVAEVDGVLVAAQPLDGGDAVADPFRRSAGLVRMLEIRAGQLRGDGKVPADAVSRRGLRRALRAW